MKGFLSEGVRDVIAIVGLTLAIIQIIALFLPRTGFVPNRIPGVNDSLRTALKFYFEALPDDAKSSLWSLVAVIGAIFVFGAVFSAVSEDAQALIAKSASYASLLSRVRVSGRLS